MYKRQILSSIMKLLKNDLFITYVSWNVIIFKVFFNKLLHD